MLLTHAIERLNDSLERGDTYLSTDGYGGCTLISSNYNFDGESYKVFKIIYNPNSYKTLPIEKLQEGIDYAKIKCKIINSYLSKSLSNTNDLGCFLNIHPEDELPEWYDIGNMEDDFSKVHISEITL